MTIYVVYRCYDHDTHPPEAAFRHEENAREYIINCFPEERFKPFWKYDNFDMDTRHKSHCIPMRYEKLELTDF